MTQPCNQCGNLAVIVDNETRRPWCIGCAKGLIKAGDPITSYTELDGAAEYTALLARGTTQTLRFR